MNKKNFIAFLMIFLDSVSFSFLLPILPLIIKDLGGSAFITGFINSSAAIGMFIGGIYFGRISDRFGRKKIILFTFILNILGYLVFGLTESILMFFIARLLNGLGGGGVAVIQAYISDNTEEKDKVEIFGNIGLVIGGGFITGIAISPLLGGLHTSYIGIISSIIMTIALAIGIFFLHEPEKHIHLENKRFNKDKIRKSHLLIIFATYMILNITLSSIQTIFPLLLNERFGLDKTSTGLIFGYFGLASVVYIFVFIKRAEKLLKEDGLIISGLLILGVSVVIGYYYCKNIPSLLLLMTLIVIGFNNINSAVFSVISKKIHKSNLGYIFGINASFGSLGNIIGPLVAGITYIQHPQITFLALGFLLVINGFIFIYKEFFKKGLDF
ncbi:MAG: MFS transporter [Candidatus Gracilibacteria bacterium]|nr:MFS transporter [Candidatus Gracilibacteria bacterium]